MHPSQPRAVTLFTALSRSQVKFQVTTDHSFSYIRDLVELSPADFWEPIAQRELHWLHNQHCAWLTHVSGVQWIGWHSETAEYVQLGDAWVPWWSCRNDNDSPFVRWFHGGQTNAVFNEVDRHVLQTQGRATAFLSDPCLLYTSPSPRDGLLSRMPSSA